VQALLRRSGASASRTSSAPATSPGEQETGNIADSNAPRYRLVLSGWSDPNEPNPLAHAFEGELVTELISGRVEFAEDRQWRFEGGGPPARVAYALRSHVKNSHSFTSVRVGQGRSISELH